MKVTSCDPTPPDDREVFCSSCRSVYVLPPRVLATELAAWMRWHAAQRHEAGNDGLLFVARELPMFAGVQLERTSEVSSIDVMRAIEWQNGWNAGHAAAFVECEAWLRRRRGGL